MPERPSLDGLEAKWSERWERDGTYRFDRRRPRSEVFSIDAPPPTVSGSLHVGHVFSYTQTDALARFQRMRGKAVFYPIGWDDNGLATERRVQNFYGVRCDPSQPYVPGFEPPAAPPEPAMPISRPNFVELCYELTATDERQFEAIFRRLGLSYDWSQHYTTIDGHSRRTSQYAFLRMLERGEAYRHEAPTLWDVDFRTAVAQAELEDKEVEAAYYRVRFASLGRPGDVEIETTRPELIPSCVALVAHPSDERYRDHFGTEVLTPLFGVRVPVLAHRLAEPDKGSGIAMVCTFGDMTDVLWWRELSLPTRTVIQRDGRFGPAPFGETGWESDDPALARANYESLEGRNSKQARRLIVEQLKEAGRIVGEPRTITHPVKFYERGERPLEIVASPQWYVRTMAMRERLLEAGRQIEWHPPFMRMRFEAWVEGLTGDWNISRQRFFGVPFPVWYRLGPDGALLDDELLLPEPGRLPVDPSTDVPNGFEESQRDEPGGFTGDPDVMDTWATSSLTPQIAGHWIDDEDLFSRVFPMDLRPQAHDIIRTWLFSTVVRSELESGTIPWRRAAISGWILDPDRKKMSKSKGNTVVPIEPFDRHGTDAVRYWALAARLGVDTAYDEQQMKVGRRLAIKVLNVTKFVIGRLGENAGSAGGEGSAHRLDASLQPLDASLLSVLAGVLDDATAAFEQLDHARCLELCESFFWSYCDDYVELVKARAYGEAATAGTESAFVALEASLSALLRSFAPFLPFAAEEAWSWWNEGSIHMAPWPTSSELAPLLGAADPDVYPAVAEVLGLVRKQKSERHLSVRAPVSRLAVSAPAEIVAAVEAAREDLLTAANAESLETAASSAGERTGVDLDLDLSVDAG
jgi:valyl-tRNA synthetase